MAKKTTNSTKSASTEATKTQSSAIKNSTSAKSQKTPSLKASKSTSVKPSVKSPKTASKPKNAKNPKNSNSPSRVMDITPVKKPLDDIEIVVHDSTSNLETNPEPLDTIPSETYETPEDLEETLASFDNNDPDADLISDAEKTQIAALEALENEEVMARAANFTEEPAAFGKNFGEGEDAQPETAQNPSVTKVKKSRRILPKLLALAAAGTLGYLAYLIVVANVLPVLHLSLALGALGLFILFDLFKNFRKKTRTPVVIILAVLNVLFSAVAVFAILKINDTLAFFDRTLSQPDSTTSVYNIIVKKGSPKNSLKDVAGSIIHTPRDLTLDSTVLADAVRDQANASVSFSDNLDSLVNLVANTNNCLSSAETLEALETSGTSNSLETGETSDDTSNETIALDCSTLEDDPIIMIHSGTYADILSEHDTFESQTKIIGEIKIEVNLERAKIDNITTKPFMIYLSGIDTRSGDLPERSLSDVNMVAVVNPTNRHLLLVSIPRDYYVHFAGTAQGALPDKLTHAGSTGGVQLSMATISELLDINLEQYARVNFNFVQNLVDAIDGINIYSDVNYNFSCWTNRSCVFKPGYNYVYGACALAFARERHAYEQGDRHRGENQQQVIKLVLDKVTSSSTLISRYSDILESLVGTFETTLTQDNITDLVKMHISDMTPWTVDTYNLDGKTGMAPTYSYPSQSLSVMYPDYDTVEIAKHKIAVAMGLEEETPETEEAEEGLED